MANYIIDDLVSETGKKQLEAVKTTVSEIVELMKQGNLTTLVSPANSNSYDKILKQNATLQSQIQILNKKHADKLAEIEAKSNAQIEALKRKSSDNLIKEREKLTAKLMDLELRLNSASQAQREKFENDALKSQQDFDNKLIIEKEKIKNKLAEIDAKELARQQDYEKRRADILADRARKEAEAIQRKANKPAPLDAQGRVDKAAQDERLKLASIAASQYTTQLQKLDAQIRLLSIDMDSKFNPALDEQTQEYRDLYSEQSKLRSEYNRLSRATGAMGSSTKSAYGSFFQMSQVMRELPNFAIDARIGFMSLSNNLPMLADEFKAVRQQIIDTEGASGSTAKTWKALGESLLSLNTIMIVVSTLLVTFGNDIIDFVGKLFGANSELEKMNKLLGEISEASFKGMGTGMEKAMRFAHDYRKAVKDGDAERIKQLEEIGRKEFGLHKEKLKMITSTTEGWRFAFKEYLEMAKKTYYNEAIIKKAVDAKMAGERAKTNALRLFNKNAKKGDESTNYEKYVKTKGFIKKYTWNDLVRMAYDDSPLEDIIETLYVWGVNQDIIDYIREIKTNNDIIKNLPKLDTSAYTSISGKGKSVTEKKLTEISAAQEFYDHERAIAIQEMARLEEMSGRTTTSGILNEYDTRKSAALAYFNISKSLYEIDAKVAEAKSKEKLEEELRNNAVKYNDNVRKFGNGKGVLINTKGDAASIKASMQAATAANSSLNISQLNESAAQLSAATVTIEQNNALRLIEINDIKNEKKTESDKKYAKTVFDINKDIYEDTAYRIDQELKLKQNSIDLETQKEEAALNKKSIWDIFTKSAFGVERDRSFDLETNKFKSSQKKLIASQKALRSKMNTASPEDRKNLQREIDAIEQEKINSKLQFEQDREISLQKKADEMKIAATESLVSSLQGIWGAYYDFLASKIEENADLEKKKIDKKVRAYEDETEAGMHTQQELSEFKERMTTYNESIDEDAAEKKKELDRDQFIAEQAAALAKVWFNYAISITDPANIGGILTPILTAQAIAGTALIAAQTIPYFAEGGIMEYSGTALLGDGGKKELAIDPSGKFFISKDTPTLYNLEKGTQILPDVNKLDLMSILALKQAMPSMSSSSDGKLMRELITAVKSQKQGNFYGMPLIRQMDRRNRIGNRGRSLMN